MNPAPERERANESADAEAHAAQAAVFQQINGFEQNNELDAAEGLLKARFGDDPQHPHAIHLKGVLAFRRGRFEDALRLMDRSMLLMPGNALYARNLCELNRVLGRLDEALTAGRHAVQLAPRDPVSLLNLAIAYFDKGQLDDALGCADRALVIQPDLALAHFERGKALLAGGRWREGWDAYEWRFRLPGVKPLIAAGSHKQWDGEPRDAGTLLLIADQGFGDVIQFSRYIPWVVSRCKDVVIAGSPEMLPTLRRFTGPRVVVSSSEAAGAFDVYCPLSGLPRLHGTHLKNIPAAPYLKADPERVARWRTRLDALVPAGYRRIAIAWAGRPTHKSDRSRSMLLDDFAPLAKLPGVALISLQKGDAASQVGGYFGKAPLINCGPELGNFEDTAALIEATDLVVCVDTAVGHLAGAIGKPTRLLLAHAGDWRWMTGREDTPWYGQHRLIRQKKPGDWTEVFGRLTAGIEGGAKR